MKRFAFVAVVTALGTTPVLVGAQQVPPTSSTTIATSGQSLVGFGQLVSALHDSSSYVQKQLTTLGTLSPEKVRVIDVTTIVKGADLEALDHVLAHHREEVDGVRAILGSQPVITAALDSSTALEDATVKDVIALDVTEQGEVLVFVYRPKADDAKPSTTTPPQAGTTTPPASTTTPPTRSPRR